MKASRFFRFLSWSGALSGTYFSIHTKNTENSTWEKRGYFYFGLAYNVSQISFNLLLGIIICILFQNKSSETIMQLMPGRKFF